MFLTDSVVHSGFEYIIYIHRIEYVDMFPTDSVLYDVDLKILTDYIYICRVYLGGGHLPTLELFSPPP